MGIVKEFLFYYWNLEIHLFGLFCFVSKFVFAYDEIEIAFNFILVKSTLNL